MTDRYDDYDNALGDVTGYMLDDFQDELPQIMRRLVDLHLPSTADHWRYSIRKYHQDHAADFLRQVADRIDGNES